MAVTLNQTQELQARRATRKIVADMTEYYTHNGYIRLTKHALGKGLTDRVQHELIARLGWRHADSDTGKEWSRQVRRDVIASWEEA